LKISNQLASDHQPLTDVSAHHDRSRRTWAFANILSGAGVVVFAFYYLTAFHFGTLFSAVERQVDFFIWRTIPPIILDTGRYPAAATGDWAYSLFPYLPSAAAMMLPLSWPPPPFAFALWLLIEAFSFAAVLWIALRLSGAAVMPGRWVIAAVAVLMCENSLGWDFRNHNNNIVYLALVMLGLASRRAWLSALAIALSINLKIYSALIPLVLAWRREFRAAAAIVITTAIIAVGLPSIVFGPEKVPQLFADWLSQIHYTMSPNNQADATVTLIPAISRLLAMNADSVVVSVLLRANQTGWFALVISYYWLARRADSLSAQAADQIRLADISVALIAPLPLSTWLIPYHAVVVLPAYVLLLAVTASNDFPSAARLFALGTVVATQVLRLGSKLINAFP
jgi:hypothetical protein